jgi:putative transposase
MVGRLLCAFIEKGRPNQNGIVERLNGLMRRHVLDAEDLATLLEARVVIRDWTIEYNQHRPHGALGGTSPNQYHKQYMTKLQTDATTSQH